MKGITKPKGIVIAAAGLLAALLIAVAIVPAMGMHEDGADDRIDKLVHDLENAVASYNEAVTGGCSDEDIANYVKNVDPILTELEALGMEVEFTTISENRGMATVDVNVTAVAERTQTHRHSISANEEQLEMINQLWGQDITIGEFTEKVMPEVMEDIPVEILEYKYATKMIWPDPFGEGKSETEITEAVREVSEPIDIQPKFIYFVSHDPDMDAEWPDIDFSSSSRVYLPHPYFKLPYMEVYSGLFYEDGTVKDFDFDDGYNVYKVEASGTYSTDTAGDYRVIGVHYGTFPPGTTPPVYVATTETDWSHVGP